MFVVCPVMFTVKSPYSVVTFSLPLVTMFPLLSLTITSILTLPTLVSAILTMVVVGIFPAVMLVVSLTLL